MSFVYWTYWVLPIITDLYTCFICRPSYIHTNTPVTNLNQKSTLGSPKHWVNQPELRLYAKNSLELGASISIPLNGQNGEKKKCGRSGALRSFRRWCHYCTKWSKCLSAGFRQRSNVRTDNGISRSKTINGVTDTHLATNGIPWVVFFLFFHGSTMINYDKLW